MDAEHKDGVKLEGREEIRHPFIDDEPFIDEEPFIDDEIPVTSISTDEIASEETAVDTIELPFWKPSGNENVLTHAIYRRLIERYIQENQTWDSQMRSDMLVESKDLDYSISRGTGVMSSYGVHKKLKTKVTWPRFWTIRVMFGPAVCARQTWFPEVLKRFPDFASKSAYTGVVPPNFEEVIELDDWVPPVPTPEECGYGRPRVAKRRAASTGIRRSKGQKEGANGVSNTLAMTAAAAAMASATASPTTIFTLQRSFETNTTEQLVETPASMSRQSMIPPDLGTNGMPPPRDNGELRSKFRPFEEVQSSQVNHLDLQNQLRELGDENIYLRQINAIQQRLIEQYQERILRLEAESRVMRGRG